LHKKKYFLSFEKYFLNLCSISAQPAFLPLLPSSLPGVGDVRYDFQDKTQTSFFRIQEIA